MDASLKEVVLDKARQMKESMEEKLGKPLTKTQMQKLLQKVYEVEKKKSSGLAGGRRGASKPMEHSDEDEDEESEEDEETEEDRDFIVESDGDEDDAPLMRKGKFVCQYTNKSFATKAEYVKHLHKLVDNMEKRIARGMQTQQPVGGLKTALTYVKIELRHLTK